MSAQSPRPLALVTGAAVRIGAALAGHLAEKGFDLLLHACGSDLTATRNACEQAGATVRELRADLSSGEELAELCRQAGEQGGLNLLVNSAAVYPESEFGSLSFDNLSSTFAINLFAPVLLTRQLQLDDGALVVNLLDSRVRETHFGYSLTKQALAEATTHMACRLAPRVRVNAICPGPVLPPIGMEGTTDARAYMRALVESTPLQRQPGLADLTLALDYLLAARTVTGQLLFVDGGEHLT